MFHWVLLLDASLLPLGGLDSPYALLLLSFVATVQRLVWDSAYEIGHLMFVRNDDNPAPSLLAFCSFYYTHSLLYMYKASGEGMTDHTLQIFRPNRHLPSSQQVALPTRYSAFPAPKPPRGHFPPTGSDNANQQGRHSQPWSSSYQQPPSITR